MKHREKRAEFSPKSVYHKPPYLTGGKPVLITLKRI
jgi:hypothetical protein